MSTNVKNLINLGGPSDVKDFKDSLNEKEKSQFRFQCNSQETNSMTKVKRRDY